MRGYISTVTLVITACCAFSAHAAEDASELWPVNPVSVAPGGDEALLGTVPVPGFYASGLLRVRGGSDTLEVVRPHDPRSTQLWLPSVWFRAAGDGAFVGVDGTELWRLDATGPERRITSLDVMNVSSTSAVGQSRGIVYFSPNTSVHGAELWRTDGTAAGTWLVHDLEPGSASSSPGSGKALGSVLFFPATTTEHGRELWRTDGTKEGTRRVIELGPGAESSNPVILGRLGSRLVFAATALEGGTTLWSTDGSRAGTHAIVTLDAHVESFASRYARQLGDVLVFPALSAEGSTWRTDGTPEGTYPLPLSHEHPESVLAGGRLWFALRRDEGNGGLWASDGSLAGTRRVWEFPDERSWSHIRDMVPLGDGVAFRADTEADGPSLWFTDATTEVTTLLQTDVENGSPIPNTYYFGMLTSTGDAAWFVAYGSPDTMLWRTDGTPEGTRPVSILGIDVEPEYPAPSPLEPFVDPGPVGPEPAAPDDPDPPGLDPPEPLAVSKLRIDLRLGGDVDLRLRCRVPLAGERGLDGEAVAIDVGGIRAAVVLNERGRARTDDGHRVKARVQRGRRGAPDTLRVDLRIRRAPVGPQLVDESLSVPPGERYVDRPVVVELRWRDTDHAEESTVRYRQRRNRGIAKLRD